MWRPPPGVAQGETVRTGVFVGVTWTEYAALVERNARNATAYDATGGALSVAAGRLSYVFNLR